MPGYDYRSMTLPELEELLTKLGQPSYRAKQLFSWLQKGAASFDDMTNLPKDFRQVLSEKGYLANAEIEARFESRLDETVKYLFRLHDGLLIESVLMSYHHGYSLCVSTQVGCRMGCSFCASTIDGLARSLTASEILAQIMSAQRDRGIRISNVVLMGMGEPFDNYDNVVRFLELVGDPAGLNIGARHISLSTCGRVDGIRRFQELGSQLTLSISLHAPNDEIRSRIMPINRKYGVDELLDACRAYIEATGRRISCEYAMIRDVNDTDACAEELADRLRGMLCHVNLIPANEVRENDYERSSDARLQRFKGLLEKRGLTVTIRRTLGGDISASCGQLRRSYK